MQDYIKKQLFVVLWVYIGQVLVGYHLGWTAPVIMKLQDEELTPLPEVITDAQSSWVASVLYIGGIFGPPTAGYVSGSFGRKPCLFLGGLTMAASFILLATAVNVAMLYAGRIFAGFALGIITVTNLVYIGEIASTAIRGMLLTATNVSLTLGILVAFAAGPFVSYPAVSYIGLGMTVLYLVGFFFIPESPTYHVLKGKTDKAEHTIALLGRTDEKDVSKILSAKDEKVPTAMDSWKSLIGMKSNRMAFYITLTLNILQQMSGVNIVTFFATPIFDMAGTIQPHIATIIIGVTQFAGSGLCPLFVDKHGRRILLMCSCIFCGLCLTSLGLYFYFDQAGYEMEAVGWLPLVSLILFFISYDLGFGIIPGALIGELYGSKARSVGSAVTFTVAWLFGFALSTVFNYMLEGIGAHFTFWIFACSCVLAFFFTLFFVPETRGKTLFEIQEMLSK